MLGEGYRVLMFSEHGDHLSEFKPVSTLRFPYRHHQYSIAFHHSSEHVVVADVDDDYVYLHIYTKDGVLVRSTHVNGIGPHQERMIVTAEGDIALLCAQEWRVFIFC